MAAPKRLVYTVDPLDVWVRLSVISEKYHEPKTTIHDLVKDLGLPVRWVGNVAYTNERAYQDAIAAAPQEKPKKDGDTKDGRRGHSRANGVGKVEVPRLVEGQPRERPKLRVEEGGL